MAENDAEPTRALSAPRPAGVAAQTLRGGGELSRMQSERPRCGGAPASCGRQPRGRTVPRGWTVFQLPSTPGSLPSVRSGFCGSDNSEIAYYFTSFSPSLAIPATGRPGRGAGEPGAPPMRGSRWTASTERASRRSSHESSARQRLLTAIATSGRPCRIRAAVAIGGPACGTGLSVLGF